MTDIKGISEPLYFYYRINTVTKMETFILRGKPITDDLEEMYYCFPSDIEMPLGTIFSIIGGVTENILLSISMEDTLKRNEEYLEKFEQIENIELSLQAFLLCASLNADYSDINSKENIAIYNLNRFISECVANYNYATNDYLEKVILANSIPFPKFDRIIVDYSYLKRKGEYSDEDMKNFLDNKMPFQKQWSEWVDGLNIEKYEYYSVDTVSGFLATLLKVIFDNRKVINICENCCCYFVPLKRSDEKYCVTNKYAGEQDCKMAVRIEKQRNRLSLKQSHIDKMERSVRSMLYYRVNSALPRNQISQKEYGKICEEIHSYKKRIEEGLCSIEEYELILKKFFKRKYK